MTRELTLMDLLDSRENRVNHQKELLEKYAVVPSIGTHTAVEIRRNVSLVSMTLNIPGPVKDRPEYRKALETGLHRLIAMFNEREEDAESRAEVQILYQEFRPLVTGPEGYIVVTGDPLEIKKAAMAAEEADALGRLFDIDVLIISDDAEPDAAGHFSLTDIQSISRSQLGGKPRQCLLCGEDAKACARSRAHSMDVLLQKINEILSDAGL